MWMLSVEGQSGVTSELSTDEVGTASAADDAEPKTEQKQDEVTVDGKRKPDDDLRFLLFKKIFSNKLVYLAYFFTIIVQLEIVDLKVAC